MHKVITFLFLESFWLININRILIPLFSVKQIKLDAIDSTNSFLRALAREEGLVESVLVVAEEQTKGKGQQGNHWRSVRGQSLTFSVFRRFGTLPMADQFMIVQAISLAVKNTLERFGVPAVMIKWPNDIMSASRKICGILIESTSESGTVKDVVMGVGLNVNEVEFDDLPRATSMKLATGTHFNLNEVLNGLADAIMSETAMIPEAAAQIRTRYAEGLFKKDAVQAFEDASGHRFNGIIRGVEDQGSLIIEMEDEVLRTFRNKEIRMLF